MSITALPDPPNRADPATFADKGDAFLGALPTFVTEANALAVAVNGDASSASAAAAAASGYADAAAASVADASGYADAAAAAAVTAINAPGTSATSATSLAISAGSKSLTIQAGKALVVGMTVKIAATASPTNWMAGDITAYDSGTGALTVSVVTTNGGGTYADWTVSLSGAATGSLPWANITGTPTTVSGYGITDAIDANYLDSAFVANQAALTLPNITGRRGVMVVAPTNAAAVPTSVTTSDGWGIATGFVAGTLGAIAATSQATPHGTWAGSAMTPPTLGMVATGVLTLIATVALSSTLAVALYRNNANFDVVAVDLTTGAMGAAVTFAAYGAATGWLFRESDTSFVAVAEHNSTGSSTIRAGSVSGTTITLGTAVTTADDFAEVHQLSAGLYMGRTPAQDLYAFAVSGTTVTLGSKVDVGSADDNKADNARIVRASDTSALLVYLAAGGGSVSTRLFSARVASVSGTTITLNSAANTGSNTEGDDKLRFLSAFAPGGPFLACVANGAVSTTGDYYGITVSGTTVSIGAVTQRTSDLPASYLPSRFINAPASPVKLHGSALLFGHRAAGPFAVTASGTTLSFGSTLALGEAVNFLQNAAGTTTYAVGASTFKKLGVAGNTLSSEWSVAVVPTVVASDAVCDKAVNYGGTWYAWGLSNILAGGLLTEKKWLRGPAGYLICAGDIE